MYWCGICQNSFISIYYLCNHLVEKHPKEVIDMLEKLFNDKKMKKFLKQEYREI